MIIFTNANITIIIITTRSTTAISIIQLIISRIIINATNTTMPLPWFIAFL